MLRSSEVFRQLVLRGESVLEGGTILLLLHDLRFGSFIAFFAAPGFLSTYALLLVGFGIILCRIGVFGLLAPIAEVVCSFLQGFSCLSFQFFSSNTMVARRSFVQGVVRAQAIVFKRVASPLAYVDHAVSEICLDIYGPEEEREDSFQCNKQQP